MLPLSLVARPLKIWTVTLKSTNRFFLKTLLKPATGGNVFSDFFKAKNEVKYKKIYFDLVQIKNSFGNFWKIKMNIKQICFQFSFCILFFDVLGRCHCPQVSKNKYWYLRSLWFLKIKTLPCVRRARARPKLTISWNWVPKNIPDQQKCVSFQKSKKKC